MTRVFILFRSSGECENNGRDAISVWSTKGRARKEIKRLQNEEDACNKRAKRFEDRVFELGGTLDLAGQIVGFIYGQTPQHAAAWKQAEAELGEHPGWAGQPNYDIQEMVIDSPESIRRYPGPLILPRNP